MGDLQRREESLWAELGPFPDGDALEALWDSDVIDTAAESRSLMIYLFFVGFVAFFFYFADLASFIAS
eukprot:COSAG04_NODE_1319_length_7241_cov_4.970176_2_plen_68_part_00